MKTISFRFDVDSHWGMVKGVPNLLSIADEFNVSFTFFINMGRAISWKGKVFSIFKKKHNYPKLSILSKLGCQGLAEAVLFNPKVGSSNITLINHMIEQGHEVGLHGGKNHGTWLHQSHSWNKKRFTSEIKWAYNKLNSTKINKVSGFASPGWKGSNSAYEVLEKLDFSYIADSHGIGDQRIRQIPGLNLIQVPTNILGEPGGVGYLEACRAKGMENQEILDDLEKQVMNKQISISYDHPVFAGIHETSLIKQIIKHIKGLDVKICTLEELITSDQ
jgi:peptidoglycan/xylan/chitin deacetylase (PgdA/CDA1 family)